MLFEESFIPCEIFLLNLTQLKTKFFILNLILVQIILKNQKEFT